MASSLKFEELCAACERVSGRPRKERWHTLRKFLDKLRASIATSQDPNEKAQGLFPVARLILPQLDRERGAYGVKEHTLALKYIRLLCLPPNGRDAMRLKNFRAPKSGGGKDTAGDFAAVASHVLQSMCRPNASQLTLAQMNLHLDSLAKHNAANEPHLVDHELEILLKATSAAEQKWIIRILLKEVRFGMGHSAILSAIHPDARKLYDVSNDLKAVCTKLQDPAIRLHEVEVTLGVPFRPMLSDKVDAGNLSRYFTAEKPKLLCETKLDGERFQIHRSRSGQFSYFSRNGFDYSSGFGVTAASGTLTPRLAPAFASHVDTCILDGEMMVWSKTLQTFKQKGLNQDVKSLRADSTSQPCYCVFDILMLNDKVLTNLTLEERLNLLSTVFTETPGTFLSTPRWIVNNEEEVRDALNRAIDKRDEGIMMKDPSSTYRPSERKAGWWKIKPEYNSELMEQLDMIILGGYHGDGRRGGIVSHFLLGAAVAPPVPGGDPTEYHSVSRVGSGFTQDELQGLLRHLQAHWSTTPPAGVMCRGEKPELWIDPKKSHVLQIKASEIVPSEMYSAGCTLRFPRVECIRYDLSWKDCLTTERLCNMRQMAAGKLTSLHITETTGPNKRKRLKKAPVAPQLASQFQPADLTSVGQDSTFLEGKEICVMTGDDNHTKQDLEKLVFQNGGVVVQNTGPSTWGVIAKTLKLQRVKNLVKVGEFGLPRVDIISPSWLLQLSRGQGFVHPEPHQLIACSLSSNLRLKKTHDRYSDSYSRRATRESLTYSLQQVKVKGDFLKPVVDEMVELEDLLLNDVKMKSIFRPFVAFFHHSEKAESSSSSSTLPVTLEMVRQEFRFYGGRVVMSLSPYVTHVVIDSSHSLEEFHAANKMHPNSMFHIVRADWVTQSRVIGRPLPEKDFPVEEL